MKSCDKCQDPIPNWSKIDGKRVNTQHRRFCLSCSPYKAHNTRDLTRPKKGRPKGGEAVTRWRKRLKSRILAAMGMKCQCCSYDACSDAMDVHHLDPTKKEHGFGGLRGHPRAWALIVKELRKCVLLCCRCHREVHAGTRTIPDTAQSFNEDWVDYRRMEMAAAFGLEPNSPD